MIRTIDAKWTSKEAAAELKQALAQDGAAFVKWTAPPPVLFMVTGDTMVIAMPKACVYVKPDTPLNAFELVKGGFPLDMANAITYFLKLARDAKTEGLEAHSAVPKISGPTE